MKKLLIQVEWKKEDLTSYLEKRITQILETDYKNKISHFHIVEEDK